MLHLEILHWSFKFNGICRVNIEPKPLRLEHSRLIRSCLRDMKILMFQILIQIKSRKMRQAKCDFDW